MKKKETLQRKEVWLPDGCINEIEKEAKVYKRKFKTHAEFILEEYAKKLKDQGAKLIVILITTTLFALPTDAQSVISAGGSEYTIGEVITFTSTDNKVTQGFHQSNIKVTDLLIINTELNISVYPNPVTEYVTIKIDDNEVGKLSYTLIEPTGKILLNSILTTTEQQIDMSPYTNGYYILKVTEGPRLSKAFNILKQ